jgi:tetratricopeptide (TPR) repeat protein
MRKPEAKPKSAPARAPATGTAPPRFPVWLLAVLLAMVTVALYWPATRHEFVNYDDDVYVTENAHVQAGLSLENLKWAFINPVCSNWHPLTMLSYMLDCQLFGLKPWGHHLTSVLLHAVNTILVFLLLRGLTGAIWRSLMVAALFGLHPLHVESVAWVAERKDVLSALFGLLSLLFYVRYAQSKSAIGHYLLALFFLALGLMSKAMLVTWPFVMLLLDYWPLARLKADNLWRLVWEKIPFFALVAVASVVTMVVQKQGGAVQAVESLPVGARVGNALISYCRYLGKLCWPTDLAVFYPYNGYWPLAEVLLAGGLVVGLSVFFWRQRRYPFMLMGWLWFVGTLVPVIGLVQVGEQAMADRYSYLPSVGLFILVTWAAYELTRRWRYRGIALSVAGLAAIILCMALTRQQIGYWQDSETLYRHALAVTENNWPAHNNLGNALLKKGQIDEAISQYQEVLRLKPDYADAHNNLGGALGQEGQLDEAIGQFQEAIRLKPDYADAHNNLGATLVRKDRLNEAISQFQEAIRLTPDYADAHNNLGAALVRKGRLNEAISQFQEAIRLEPDNAIIHNNLGATLDKKGQLNEAISQFQEAIRLKPDYTDAHNNLGNALVRKGQLNEAISQFQEAIRLKPDYADAHNHLGYVLDKKGQLDEAIGQFQEAIRLKPDYADAHNNLGVALGQEGQLDEAIGQFQEAIRLKPDYADAHNNLGNALAAKGRFDEAIENYRQAIQVNSNNPETFFHFGMTLGQLGRTREAVAQYREALRLNPNLVGALNNLAWALATSPDDTLRNGAEATRLAVRACELTHYGQPVILGTLAAAYAESGRFPEAVTMAEKAEKLATSAGLTAVAAKNRQLLELYRAGKPYHEFPPAASSSPPTPSHRTEQ